jgi:hypothetical protein
MLKRVKQHHKANQNRKAFDYKIASSVLPIFKKE